MTGPSEFRKLLTDTLTDAIRPEVERKRVALNVLADQVATDLKANAEAPEPVDEVTIFAHLSERIRLIVDPTSLPHVLAVAVIEMAKARNAAAETVKED